MGKLEKIVCCSITFTDGLGACGPGGATSWERLKLSEPSKPEPPTGSTLHRTSPDISEKNVIQYAFLTTNPLVLEVLEFWTKIVIYFVDENSKSKSRNLFKIRIKTRFHF